MSEHILVELRATRRRHDEELRALVGSAVGAGARTQDIADAMGISRATLWRRYGTDLQRGENGRATGAAVRETA